MIGGHVGNGTLAELYDSLSRWQWLRCRLCGAGPGRSLAMHKQLRGMPELDQWLHERVNLAPGARVLDIGCGFGSTLFAWAARTQGTYVGLSPVRFQVRAAQRQAQALGLAAGCMFRHMDYEDPRAASDASFARPFDVAISIETLFHAADLDTALARVAACVRPGGALALVEDMAASEEARGFADAAALLHLWRTARLHTIADFRLALALTGFRIREEVDLTACLAARAALERRTKHLRRLARLPLPARWRRVVDAFAGGLALERLYARGAMRYVTIIAERVGAWR